MRAAGIAALILATTLTGWAMEMVRPVLFSDEPVTVVTPPEAPAPKLEFCGQPYQVDWSSQPVTGGVRWEADFPRGAPLGVWVVSDLKGCISFLRIPATWAVLELAGAAGAEVEAPGLYQITVPGGVLVIGPAGEWDIAYCFPGQDPPHALHPSLNPHDWQRLLIGRLDLVPSSPLVLPGHEFLLRAVVLSPVDIPALEEALELPSGWTATPAACSACPPEMAEPIPAGVLTTRAWRIWVPEDTPTGTYSIRATLPGIGLVGSLNLEVAARLPIRVVVAHWDTTTDRLDLTLDPTIDYEQLLWAASLLGQEVPYTGRVMSTGMLDHLAELWEAGR